MARKKKPNDYGTGIPLHEVEALARVLLPEIQAFLRARRGRGSFGSGKYSGTRNKRNRHSTGRGHPLTMFPPRFIPLTKFMENLQKYFCQANSSIFCSMTQPQPGVLRLL